jgi:hypothetical protein
VGCIELKELEILMFVINGDQDILEDNGWACSLSVVIITIVWWTND